MDLSFGDGDYVIDVNERLLEKLFREILGVEVSLPIPRMTWQEAMARYGSDKPDTRFGMELHCLNEVFAKTGFKIFRSVLDEGGEVECIVARQAAGRYSRK